jgi:hypothetical protein
LPRAPVRGSHGPAAPGWLQASDGQKRSDSDRLDVGRRAVRLGRSRVPVRCARRGLTAHASVRSAARTGGSAVPMRIQCVLSTFQFFLPVFALELPPCGLAGPHFSLMTGFAVGLVELQNVAAGDQKGDSCGSTDAEQSSTGNMPRAHREGISHRKPESAVWMLAAVEPHIDPPPGKTRPLTRDHLSLGSSRGQPSMASECLLDTNGHFVGQ